MSDEIPFHIQEEIIKRLPVKPLVQFRSVSKAWKSLIDSSDFIAAHTHSVTQPQNLLLKYKDPVETTEKYVCVVDDDTFPQQRFVHTPPLSIKLLKSSKIVGSSHGLLCLRGYYSEAQDSFPNMGAFVVWNPSVRKSIVVGVPKKDNKTRFTIFGFGVCPITSDPIILEISQPRMPLQGRSKINDCSKVDVYKLSSGNWRSLSSNLSSRLRADTGPQVVIDRFIYWPAFNTKIRDGWLQTYHLILSFDMSNENFEEVDLPDSLANQPLPCKELSISISKLRDSLAVVNLQTDNEDNVFVVWMMENSVQKSFTKLFTIKTPLGSMLLGFRKNGKPIIEVGNGYDYTSDQSELDVDYTSDQSELVYERNSDQFNDLEICGTSRSFSLNSCMESLLLLSRSDCSIMDMNDGGR